MPNRPAGNSGNLCCRHQGEQERIRRPPFGGRHRRNGPAISRGAAHGGRFRNAVPGNRKSAANTVMSRLAPARAHLRSPLTRPIRTGRAGSNVRLPDRFDGRSPTVAYRRIPPSHRIPLLTGDRDVMRERPLRAHDQDRGFPLSARFAVEPSGRARIALRRCSIALWCGDRRDSLCGTSMSQGHNGSVAL
jgi:hypothetical protein